MWRWSSRGKRVVGGGVEGGAGEGSDVVHPVPIEMAMPWPLAGECEAFLAGRYAEYLEGQGVGVPMWARLNRLCHLDEAGVLALAEGRAPRRRREDPVWTAALAYLAEEVLTTAARWGTTVAEVQRSVLVPLELGLARGNQRASARPAALVRTVAQALGEHPGRLHHPIG
ncbi:MAG: hypothetical protein ACRDZQ_08750 [Acidimicrobiales bacterium]